MSNAVLPALAGLTFPVKKTPIWSTSVKTAASGRETRAAAWSYPRWNYSLGFDLLRSDATAELQQLVGFFNARQGSFDDWLFLDPDDNMVSNQLFGLGTGAQTVFQLARAYGGFAEPVTALATAPAITWNGAPANLVNNSSFETVTSGRPTGFGEYNNASIATTYTAPSGRSGGRAFGLRAEAATTATFGVLGSWSYDGTGGVRTGWQAFATYTVAFYARIVGGGAGWASAGMQLAWNTAPLNPNVSANPTLSTSWQRYVFTFTWGGSVEPNGSFFISVAASTLAGDEIAIDDLQITQAPTASPYVAGDQGYTISPSGVVTFSAAPPNGIALAWSGSFYRRCRFVEDQIELEKFMAKLWSLGKLEFLSVK